MVPHVHRGGAGRRRDDADQARGDGDLDVNAERQRHEGNQEDAAADSQIGPGEARQERGEGQQEEHIDRRHAGRLDAGTINVFPRFGNHFDNTISIALTFVARPSSAVTFSVAMRTSRTSASGMKRPRTISATSTAREMERPRAFTTTSREPPLKCVTTART